MLIVEGPDGSGKTTLIRQFQAEFDLPIAPRVVSKDTEAMTDLVDWVDNNLEEGFQSMIFDRHRLISEPIYGPILRPHIRNEFMDLGWLGPRIDRFYQIEPIIIYCLPPFGDVEFNTAHDDDNEVVRFKMGAIYKQYVHKAAMDHSLAPGTVKIWDYTKSPRIKDRSMWFNTIYQQIKGRTAA